MAPGTVKLLLVALVIGFAVAASVSMMSEKHPAAWYESTDADIGDDFVIRTPSGFRLCTPPDDTSVSNGVIIPVEAGVRCDAFMQNADRKTWPSHLSASRTFDAAESYETTAELARDHDTCFDMPGAETFTKTESTSLDGMATITCAIAYRDGRYEKLAVAYRHDERHPRTNYFVRLSAKTTGRARADKLFEDVVASFRLTN